jgi:hypothetical protein
MEYTFWDYLPGMLVFGAFFGPIIAMIVLKIGIMIAVWFATFSGATYATSDREMTVRIKHYDMDEDC